MGYKGQWGLMVITLACLVSTVHSGTTMVDCGMYSVAALCCLGILWSEHKDRE